MHTVKLADGRTVVCPERCLAPDDIKPDDELHRTLGFSSLTVLASDGTVQGWVPALAAKRHPEKVR